MDLLPFFQWCYQTPIGETIRNSTWLFPVIEAFHLLGLGLTAGAVLVVDLRLLGLGLNRAPVAQLAAAARPWLIGGLILMFMSGIPLFLSESIKCLYNYAFWVKMTSLLLVLLFTFTIRRRVTRLYDLRSTAARPIYGAHIVKSVVWCCGGRTLDRVFVAGAWTRRTDLGSPPTATIAGGDS
jgi:pimeloyl-ACP methyl ester carboxylesterase